MRAPVIRTVLGVATVLAVAAAAACTAGGQDDSRRRDRDALVFGVAGDPKVLDPALASDGESLRVARQVYETLVKPEVGGTRIVAGLAESFTPDAAGTTWTFKLRRGVRFHDGTPFDAAAVCFNFDRWYHFSGLLQSPDVSAYWQDVFGGFARNERSALPPSLFKSCTVRDARTVEVAITRVTSKFPAALAQPSFSISSPQALLRYQADRIGGTPASVAYPPYAMAHPTGTGPYKFVAWDAAKQTVTLERYDGYAGPNAKIKKVIFKTISDEGARRKALRADQIQGYDLVGPDDVRALKKAGFNLLTRPAFNISYLGINQNGPARKALSNVLVRRAIAYAINREALVASEYPAGSSVAVNFHPPSLEGYNPDVTRYPYDPVQARQLLTQAGAANLTVRFLYPTEVTRPYLPAPKDVFESIRLDLAIVGITVVPVPMKWSPDYLNAIEAGTDHDLHLLGWTGDYADAYNFIGTFFDRQKNEWGFRDPALFDAFRAADSEPDQIRRVAMYKEINRQLLDFLPGVPLAHAPPSLVFAKDVTGVRPSPLAEERFADAEYRSST